MPKARLVLPSDIPSDLEAEQHVLGAALVSAEAARAAVGELEAGDFYSSSCRLLFEAIRELTRRGEFVDQLTAKAELERTGRLEEVDGGALFVADVASAVPLPGNHPAYIRRVRDVSQRRRLATVGLRVVQYASNGQDPAALAQDLEELRAIAGDHPARPRAGGLEVLDVSDLLDRVETAGPPSWLIEGLWPADAYGVIGAEDKAGKTWATLDLAVSVASGTPWLGHFPSCSGPVVMFLGEGGMRNFHRRLGAVCESKGIRILDLQGRLRICLRVPRLREGAELEAVAAELEAHPATLATMDPFYLAAAGARGSDLYEMGQVLGATQRVCEEADTALVLVASWNKTGQGSGVERFTGVGPGAWGRVLASAAVDQRSTAPDGASTVRLRWQFRGSEIPDSAFRVRRRVWTKDPQDLLSPMFYEVEVTQADMTREDALAPSRRRVLAALERGGPELGVRHIGDLVADDGQGKPLKARTIQYALKDLETLGMAEGSESISGLQRYWSMRPPK